MSNGQETVDYDNIIRDSTVSKMQEIRRVPSSIDVQEPLTHANAESAKV